MKMDFIRKQIEESLNVKKLLLDDIYIQKSIKESSDICCKAIKNGNKILFIGNGGSAADAQHLAGELVNRFGFERPGLSAIALTTDTSVITSIANDYGFEKVFSRQVQAVGIKGDVLLALSTSGNSANILEGINEAHNRGITTIGLTGLKGGKMSGLCDLCIIVPTDDTPRIQEAHILIGHIICSMIENIIFGK
jgi:D-sedoheptulose 7-phosphate isomerase